MNENLKMKKRLHIFPDVLILDNLNNKNQISAQQSQLLSEINCMSLIVEGCPFSDTSLAFSDYQNFEEIDSLEIGKVVFWFSGRLTNQLRMTWAVHHLCRHLPLDNLIIDRSAIIFDQRDVLQSEDATQLFQKQSPLTSELDEFCDRIWNTTATDHESQRSTLELWQNVPFFTCSVLRSLKKQLDLLVAKGDSFSYVDQAIIESISESANSNVAHVVSSCLAKNLPLVDVEIIDRVKTLTDSGVLLASDQAIKASSKIGLNPNKPEVHGPLFQFSNIQLI